MLLLNTKSVMECDEKEEIIHNEEIMYYVNCIDELPNYNCAVIIKYIDPAHKNKKEQIMECELHDFMNMIEYCDIKNGADLYIDSNGLFSIVTYGQFYKMKDEWFNIQTKIDILPFDENKEFLSISSFLIDAMIKIKETN